jgi:predicted PurR-regulated permease PerM
MAWWGILLWPTLVFTIVQLLEGYVLTPAIAGKATKLDPVTIVVVVLAGGSVLGVYGMLLAIPVAACGKILVAEVLMPRIRAWTRGELADPLPIERE